jgi:hypothetical protein
VGPFRPDDPATVKLYVVAALAGAVIETSEAAITDKPRVARKMRFMLSV